MITYNLFRERKFKIDDEKVWMTPFQLAGAKYTDAQEAWDILKVFYSEIYSKFKPAARRRPQVSRAPLLKLRKLIP